MFSILLAYVGNTVVTLVLFLWAVELLVCSFDFQLSTSSNMDRQDDNIKPAITDLFTVIHELWYVSTITINSAYHTFCTATFWYCLSEKGLESFNAGLKDRPRPLESYRTSIGEKEKKRKLEMLSRQKVELFISDYTKKAVHHVWEQGTPTSWWSPHWGQYTNTQSISAVKSKFYSDDIYCRKISGSHRGTVRYLNLLGCDTM